METKEIVILAKQKNKLAERQLFDLLAPRLMGICKRYSKDTHQAKDYFQDCFIKIFDKIDKYDDNLGKFESWAFTVSTNLILEDKRKKSKMIFSELDNINEASITENELDLIDNNEITKAILKLPNGYREILNLYVFEKWSHKEIAKALNIKEGTSRSQYAKAKGLLKKLLVHSIPNIHEKQLV